MEANPTEALQEPIRKRVGGSLSRKPTGETSDEPSLNCRKV
jgi:hypothetical protein